MSNKNTEENILKLVYTPLCYDSLIRSEKPDFILEKDSIAFGVELTEYFFHNSSARIKNQKDYTKLVANNEWVHKDDVSLLESIDTWKINDYGSESYTGRAVKRLNPTWQEKFNKLNSIIIEKGLKYLIYNKSLEYVDLLIYDNCEMRRGLDTCELFAFLYKRVVANDLNTPYKHVTLVLLEDNRVTNTFILKN